MTQILANHTRVTTVYKGREAKGAIIEGSTERFARVEILGYHGKRPEIDVPWSAVKKDEHRAFTAKVVEGVMVITEVAPKNSHPMNWSGLSEYSREGAWAYAQCMGLETVFVSREGERKELGRVFDPRSFEQAAYGGYVGYGQSMTDGFYAPEKFDSWVKGFRKHPAEHLNSQNDAPEAVKAALPLYLEALAAKGL